MIISKSQVQNILKTYGKQLGVNKVNKAGESKAAAKNDQISISSESKIKQRAMQAVKQAEDMRLDKVKELQEKVSAGTYTLADDEVAEKMIERAIVDKLI